MSAAPDARKLTGAAYAAARAKLVRGGYADRPPAVAPKPLGEMTAEEYEAANNPKKVSEMTPGEYAAARKRIIARA